jgi:endoglucanase
MLHRVTRNEALRFGARWLVPVIAAALVFGMLLTFGSAELRADSPIKTPALEVRGNRLVSSSGKDVVLRGVNRMGFEYSCVQGKGAFEELSADPLDQASVDGMKTWGINAVRLPLNEHCWLGIGGTPTGEPYQRAVRSYVELLLANDLYVILDLHWSAPGTASATSQDPMPNTDHSADFWTSVAKVFKGDDRVLFDLFNEPVPNSNQSDDSDHAARRSWQCWRDGAAGGTCDATQLRGMTGAQVAGMQSLVDAVRATDATNVIVLGGIQWANTLWSNSARNWLAYRPHDPLNKIVASFHAYPFTRCVTVACYEREIAPIAALVPVIAGEFGNDACDAVWISTLLNWLDGQQIGYLAWVWHTALPDDCASKHLLETYAGAPSRYGEIYKAHLGSQSPPRR